MPSIEEIYVPFEKNCSCATDHRTPSDHMSELPIMSQALSNPPRHNIRQPATICPLMELVHLQWNTSKSRWFKQVLLEQTAQTPGHHTTIIPAPPQLTLTPVCKLPYNQLQEEEKSCIWLVESFLSMWLRMDGSYDTASLRGHLEKQEWKKISVGRTSGGAPGHPFCGQRSAPRLEYIWIQGQWWKDCMAGSGLEEEIWEGTRSLG